MSQKKIEEQQRKILFAHFKAGTLERKMDTAYRGEETAEAAKTTETAETTESAKPVRYDYEFDFKYLLGNYYKAYQGDDYYNDRWRHHEFLRHNIQGFLRRRKR